MARGSAWRSGADCSPENSASGARLRRGRRDTPSTAESSGRSRKPPPTRQCWISSPSVCNAGNAPVKRHFTCGIVTGWRHSSSTFLYLGPDGVRRVFLLGEVSHRHDATGVHRIVGNRQLGGNAAVVIAGHEHRIIVSHHGGGIGGQAGRRRRSDPSGAAADGTRSRCPASANAARFPARLPAETYESGRSRGDTSRSALRKTAPAASSHSPVPLRRPARDWIPPSGSSAPNTERSVRPRAFRVGLAGGPD